MFLQNNAQVYACFPYGDVRFFCKWFLLNYAQAHACCPYIAVMVSLNGLYKTMHMHVVLMVM